MPCIVDIMNRFNYNDYIKNSCSVWGVTMEIIYIDFPENNSSIKSIFIKNILFVNNNYCKEAKTETIFLHHNFQENQ